MSSENEPMSPEMKDEVDARLLARVISSLTVDLSLPNEPPKWGHLSEESALTVARCVTGLDRIIENHLGRDR